MNAIRRKRIRGRIIAMVLLTLILAFLLPLVLEKPVQNVFYLDDDSQETALRFTDMTKWSHVGGIVAVFILNLVFFIKNEKTGDSGDSLRRRNSLQRILNLLVVLLGLAVMIGLRFSLISGQMIYEFLSDDFFSMVYMLSPYYVFVIAAWILGSFCMRAVPATNCAVRNSLARKIDDDIKRAARTR